MYHQYMLNELTLTLVKVTAEIRLKSRVSQSDSAIKTFQVQIDPTFRPLISQNGG